jgi:hypothetical protein
MRHGSHSMSLYYLLQETQIISPTKKKNRSLRDAFDDIALKLGFEII